MAKKATIYEVAEKADVSTTTVSRVLNKSPHVSDETKKRVLSVIDELNFTPQLTARKLATSEPQILSVVVPSFTTPYYNEVLKGIKDKIMRTDLDLVLYNTGSRRKQEGLQRFFDRGMADAVIIMSIEITDKVHKQLQATQTPAVLINTMHPDYSYVELNDYRGGYLAGEHLAKQGFNEIGMISTYEDFQTSIDRKNGFKDALEEYGVPINEDFFVKGNSTKHGGFTEESGFEAVHKFLNRDHFPDAIFCLDDTQAIGAIYALSQVGMSVPDDIAVMGYDNIKLSKYLQLSTIDQKMYSIGTAAIERINEIIENPSDKSLKQEKVDPILLERGSTKNKKMQDD